MKTIKFLSICFLLSLATLAQANDGYVFKVLASKGTSQVKSSATMDWQPVKTGAVLRSGDELQVSEDSYLGLVHVTGRTLELTTAGEVDINQLAAELKSQTSSISSKYAEFVLNKMSDAEMNGRDQLLATGAVERELNSDLINVYMPSVGEVYQSHARIHWNEVEGSPTYRVTVMNSFDEVVLEQLTSATSIEIDLNQSTLVRERLLILNVAVDGSSKIKSENFGIKRLTEEERSEIQAMVEELADVDSGSSLSEIIKASLYEQHNLLVDAATSYQKAIELSPEVDDFERMYRAFIDRNNLD